MLGQFNDFFKNSSRSLGYQKIANVTLTNIYHDITTFKKNITWIDFVSIGLSIYLIFTIRYFVDRYVKSVSAKRSMDNAGKAVDSGYKQVFLVTSTLLGVWILFRSGCDVCFAYPRHEYSPHMAIPLEVRLFYIFQMGYYLFASYSENLLAPPRTSFHAVMMNIHHVVTFSLIFGSYATRAHDCGTIIAFLHDLNDIFLEGAKFLIAFQEPNTKPNPLNKIIIYTCAALLPVSWYTSRLYFYPLVGMTRTFVMPPYVSFTLLFGLLWVILIMDIIWSYYMLLYYLKVVRRQRALRDPTGEDKDKWD